MDKEKYKAIVKSIEPLYETKPFMEYEKKILKGLIKPDKEEKKYKNSQKTYGYYVNPDTGKLVSEQPRRKVVKTIRIKKSKRLNSPVTLGKE